MAAALTGLLALALAASSTASPAAKEPRALIEPGILLQVWAFDTHRGGSDLPALRVRRMEISLEGELAPDRLSYAVNVDPTIAIDPPKGEAPEGPIAILKDAFLTLHTEWADFSAGQFRIPVSFEGYRSSSRIILPERAPSSSRFGDKRDLGIRVEKRFELLRYTAGLYNGTGANQKENDAAKDLGLRLELTPLPELLVAGAFYRTIGDLDADGAKERIEGSLQLDLGVFLLQGEVIRGRDSGTPSYGFYAAAGVRPIPELLLVARAGRLDPDLDRDLAPEPSSRSDDELWHADLGASWQLHEHFETQLSVTRSWYDDRLPETIVILAGEISL